MEASGVAKAAFQATDRPGFFMIRGVSDLADEHKGSTDVEEWRTYACKVAATFTIAFLQSGPIPLNTSPNLSALKVDIEELTISNPISNAVALDQMDFSKQENDPPEDNNNFEYPIGRLLEDIYTIIWEKEKARYPILINDSSLWKERTGELAIITDGHQISFPRGKAVDILGSDKALFWILNSGFLKPSNSLPWIQFATELTKIYFCAYYLRPYIQIEAFDEVYQLTLSMKTIFKDKLLKILSQITSEDISPIIK